MVGPINDSADLMSPKGAMIVENGSFQMKKISHLSMDFDEDVRSVEPAKPLPKDWSRSSTIESLLSQNEDLAARLKVSLRRQALLEAENQKMANEYHAMKETLASQKDQMLVWEEKERVWRDRIIRAEDGLQKMKDRFPDYLQMETKIERYRKYQEKVKTQIKPYIQTLKDFAENLRRDIAVLTQEIEQKNQTIVDLKNQISQLSEESNRKIAYIENNYHQQFVDLENERNFLKQEINVLNQTHLQLETKADQLEAAQERVDELENLVIALRRNKEDSNQRLLSEIDQLKSEASKLRQEAELAKIHKEDFEQQLQRLQTDLEKSEGKKMDLEQQLSSARFLWSTKSQEVSKLELALQSLEKMNRELSQKLESIENKSNGRVAEVTW